MKSDLLTGEKVRLTAENPEIIARCFFNWYRDSEWFRLFDNDPPRLYSEKKWKEWLEKDLENDPHGMVSFGIRILVGDELIGVIGLFNINPTDGDALVAIGLGGRKDWGKGYGTDAMSVLLRYAFNELNLQRVGLIVFEYNPRAIRSYEKSGFVHEGRLRQAVLREGRRWDCIYMSVLREEWLSRQGIAA